jgi:hypothetical protein
MSAAADELFYENGINLDGDRNAPQAARALAAQMIPS